MRARSVTPCWETSVADWDSTLGPEWAACATSGLEWATGAATASTAKAIMNGLAIRAIRRFSAECRPTCTRTFVHMAGRPG